MTRIKFWAPHMVCKTCTEYLHHWTNGKKICVKFGIPMVWREPTNHATDCYFSAIDVTWINRKNRSSLRYPDLESVRSSVAHCDEISVHVSGELTDISVPCFFLKREGLGVLYRYCTASAQAWSVTV